MDPSLPFQGLKIEDLNPCSYIEQRIRRNSTISEARAKRECFPLRTGSVVVDAGSLIRLGPAKINAVGLVIDGRQRSIEVMLLEVNDKDSSYKSKKLGDIGHFQDFCSWTLGSGRYDVTEEQRSLLDTKVKEMKAKKKRAAADKREKAKKAKKDEGVKAK